MGRCTTTPEWEERNADFGVRNPALVFAALKLPSGWLGAVVRDQQPTLPTVGKSKALQCLPWSIEVLVPAVKVDDVLAGIRVEGHPETVIGLRASGLSLRNIAKEVGVSAGTVHKLLRDQGRWAE